jgi:phosphoglycerate-specific signal transduction histidine kinase
LILLYHIRTSYKFHNLIFNELNQIIAALNKLPKTEEFNQIREEVQNIHELANDTLLPIKKEREKMEKIL